MRTSPDERLRRALTDRYRIVRELGAGGMAAVYLADDLKHGRQVATVKRRTRTLGPADTASANR